MPIPYIWLLSSKDMPFSVLHPYSSTSQVWLLSLWTLKSYFPSDYYYCEYYGTYSPNAISVPYKTHKIVLSNIYLPAPASPTQITWKLNLFTQESHDTIQEWLNCQMWPSPLTTNLFYTSPSIYFPHSSLYICHRSIYSSSLYLYIYSIYKIP